MKRPILFLSLLPALLLAAPHNASLPADSAIRAVTVYPDRALVARTAEVTLPAGETTIVLTGLPANLRDDSLQVSGQGPAGTSILDVQSRNHFVTAEPSPEIRRLEEQLTSLRRDRRVLDQKQSALNQQQQVLQRIIEAATTVPAAGPTAPTGFEAWNELLAFNQTETAKLNDAHLQLDDDRQTLDAQITAAEQQLNDARGRLPGRRAVKEVTVRVATTAPGPATLTLAYTVPGAAWQPTYRARLDSTTRRVAFDYQAQVTNRTGEAWHDVALTLSTARPAAGGAAPEAFPWIVQEQPRYETRRKVGFGATAMPAPAAMADSVQEFAVEENMVAATASVETGLTSAAFHITAPATIPADGTQHRVAITTLDLPADLRHDTTPKFDPAAYLTATVTNNSDYPLLRGPLAAFVDGAFIANSTLAPTMAHEDFDLALGVDDGVQIERTLVNRFVEKTGLTNSGRRTTYEIALDITNHKSTPVTLRLAEALPVSRHEKIEVKLLEPSPRQIGGLNDDNAFRRDNEGILTWHSSLAPGANQTLTLKFSIEHPADMDVSGVE